MDNVTLYLDRSKIKNAGIKELEVNIKESLPKPKKIDKTFTITCKYKFPNAKKIKKLLHLCERTKKIRVKKKLFKRVLKLSNGMPLYKKLWRK